MKKFFQVLGLISLTIFSFFATEKTAIVVNNMDEIMVQIKQNKDKYRKKALGATIKDNTIIPGINGRIVNTKKSYKNMKINGYYSDKLYIYEYNRPIVSLEDNKNKYIIKGNKEKRMISLIFKLKNDIDITNIISILNNYRAKSTFFVDINWFTNNTNLVEQMIKDGHNIGILLDDYDTNDFLWTDTVIKNINKQKHGFCYNAKKIEVCAQNNDYTIRPIEISEYTPLVDLKKYIDTENLFSFELNSTLKKELINIIIYIKSKGYKLENLENHILE